MRRDPIWWLILHYWGYLAPLLMLIWAFRPKKYFATLDWERGNLPQMILALFIGLSAFFGVGVLISGFLEPLLSFLPSWFDFADDFGETKTATHVISFMVALVAAYGFVYSLKEKNEKRRDQLEKNKEVRMP